MAEGVLMTLARAHGVVAYVAIFLAVPTDTGLANAICWATVFYWTIVAVVGAIEAILPS